MPHKLGDMGRPKKKEPSDLMRLPRSIIRRIRRLASHHGVDPGEFVEETYGPVLSRKEKKMMQDIAKEQKDEK